MQQHLILRAKLLFCYIHKSLCHLYHIEFELHQIFVC